MGGRQVKEGAQVLTRKRAKVMEPGMWKVLLHNDDYTTQEFVDWVLISVFNHDPESAHRIMLQVHMHGVGVAGIYPYEIAETKVAQVVDFALSKELAAFRDSVRDYAQQHLGHAAEWDEGAKFPRSAIDAAARLGLLRTTVARQYGGSEMGNLASCVMLEEINAVCASTGVTISVHNSLVNSRPTAAATCATNLIGANLSRRAINESCRVEGMASWGVAPLSSPFSSRKRPVSSTALVSSSTKSGTPSDRRTMALRVATDSIVVPAAALSSPTVSSSRNRGRAMVSVSAARGEVEASGRPVRTIRSLVPSLRRRTSANTSAAGVRSAPSCPAMRSRSRPPNEPFIE